MFGLSGYLGRRWADRALETQRHEYAQLNVQFTHQLDLVSRQVQIELDAIGHLYKLRTESEFQKIGELWARIAALKDAFAALPKPGFAFVNPDPAKQREYHRLTSTQFIERFQEAYELWNKETLAIPEDIADAAHELLKIAQEEAMQAIQYPDPFEPAAMAAFNEKARSDWFDNRVKNMQEFATKADTLKGMMRQYRKGPARGSVVEVKK